MALRTLSLLTALNFLATQPMVTESHGRMIEPPSRASMWRFGFNTPRDYDDTASYCGGFNAQWGVNGGKCGVCGDRYDRVHEHEAGGKYANGVIVRHYRQGETITVKVELTTSHMGYFEFRICPHNNPAVPVSQDCLDKYLLSQTDGSTRLKISRSQQGVRTVSLVLPAGLTCTQCVLQWKYVTGNFWGCEGVGPQRKCGMGFGRQEHYYACADVDVISSSGLGSHQFQTASTGNTNFPYIGNNHLPNPNTPFPIITPNQLQTQTLSPFQNFIPNNHNNNNGQYVSQAPVYNQCRGIRDSLTDYCRRNCLAGFCSRMYCTEACMWLRTANNQPEQIET